MKTTIDFPDDLLHRAKVLAAERRTTLKDLMIQALRQIAEPDSAADDGARKTKFIKLLRKMKATNTSPMQPLTREETHGR